MLLNREKLKYISTLIPIKTTKLLEMCHGEGSDKELLFAYVLYSIPTNFYKELSCDFTNKVCDTMSCLSDDDLNGLFSKTLINRYKRDDRFDFLFKVLKNIPICFIDGCKIQLTTYKQQDSLFVSSINEETCEACVLSSDCSIAKDS